MSAIELKNKFYKYIFPKLKFGGSSIVSTSVDYAVFYGLLTYLVTLPVFFVQIIAQSCGMITNFVIHRNFIFEKNRTITSSFFWSISFSLMAILLAGTLVHYLYQISFFNNNTIVMKVGVSALFFIFNFYTKQYAFEKKLKL